MNTDFFVVGCLPFIMISFSNLQEKYLKHLSVQGYFVEIKGAYNTRDIVVDCSIYYKDTDDSGNPAEFLCCSRNNPCSYDENGHCCFCDQSSQGSFQRKWLNEQRKFQCPQCGLLAPLHLRRRTFRGLFRFIPGKVASFLIPMEGDNILPMKNDEQIQAIVEALLSVPAV